MTYLSGSRCARSPQEFGKRYLPHYFSKAAPPFHVQLCRLWQTRVMGGRSPDTGLSEMLGQKGGNMCIAAPRGHAKSTVITLQGVLHAALYGYKRYIIIISDTSAQAATFLDCIKTELTENEQIKQDFGEQKSKTWTSARIKLKNGCLIEAAGARQKLRGRRNGERRPDLIILDDVENDANVRSQTLRRQLKSWFDSAVSRCGDSYTSIVFVGTMLHSDSLLATALKNPSYLSRTYRAVEQYSSSSLWKQWRELYTNLQNDSRERDAERFFVKNKKTMLEGTKTLWPQKHSYYELMCMKISEGDIAFNREMQNMPLSPEQCLFSRDRLTFFEGHEVNFRDDRFRFFGYCDPSLGQSRTSDFSAIITLARDEQSGAMYVLEADLQRRHPNVIIEDVLRSELYLRERFGKGYTLFGAEINQFQWFLKEQMAQKSAERGIYLPLCEVRASSDKVLRIQSLQPYIENRYLRFSRAHEELLDQLCAFPLGAHDDGPDALEGCISICRKAASAPVSGLRV